LLKYTEPGGIPEDAWRVICKAIEFNLDNWGDIDFYETLENLEDLKTNYGPAYFSPNW